MFGVRGWRMGIVMWVGGLEIGGDGCVEEVVGVGFRSGRRSWRFGWVLRE